MPRPPVPSPSEPTSEAPEPSLEPLVRPLPLPSSVTVPPGWKRVEGLQPKLLGGTLSQEMLKGARMLYELEQESARIKELIDSTVKLLLDARGLACKAMLVIDDQNRVYLVPIEEDR